MRIIRTIILAVTSVIAFSAFVPAVSAGAAVALPGARAAVHATASAPDSQSRRCSRPYQYSNGVKGLAQVPFNKAEWTGDPNHCATYMQTGVKSGTSCHLYKSGVVKGTGIWDEADGLAGQPYCSSWIHFKACSTCVWGSWERLSDTSAPAGKIMLTAAVHGLPHSLAPHPAAGRDVNAQRVTCGSSCYHIRQKNGSQFFAGFNSDADGYYLRSKDDTAARDFILVTVPGGCSLGSSCFKARMVTVNNLEVVGDNCSPGNFGQTLALRSGTGHTGDVFEFSIDSSGDNFITSQHCGYEVAFQNKLDAYMVFGTGPGLYNRVLYFPGT